MCLWKWLQFYHQSKVWREQIKVKKCFSMTALLPQVHTYAGWQELFGNQFVGKIKIHFFSNWNPNRMLDYDYPPLAISELLMSTKCSPKVHLPPCRCSLSSLFPGNLPLLSASVPPKFHADEQLLLAPQEQRLVVVRQLSRGEAALGQRVAPQDADECNLVVVGQWSTQDLNCLKYWFLCT